MSRYRILVADKIAREGLTPIADDPRFTLIERPGLKEDALAEALAEADAVIVRSATRITRGALGLTTSLKVIGRAGVGVDTIDVDAATEKGIAVMAGNRADCPCGFCHKLGERLCLRRYPRHPAE